MILNKTWKVDTSRVRIDLRKLICINLIIIALMDSYLVYNDILIFKLFTYGLKFLNLLSLVLLVQNNYLKNYLFVIAVLPIWWAFYNEDSLLISIQLLYSGILPLATFALITEDERYYIVETYIRVFVKLLMLGLPIYILVNIIDIPPLFTSMKGINGRLYENYFLFFWTREGVELRYSSVFDEPGVVGTISIIILFYYRKMLSKLETLVLIVSGVLSFSLFFIVLIIPILYFSNFRSLNKTKVVARTVFATVFFIISYASLVLLVGLTKNDPVLKHRVHDRFEWQDNLIVGIVNNRDRPVRGFEYEYSQYINEINTNSMVGKGKDYMLKEYGGSTLSYRVFILERGILITIYLLGFYALLHYWRRDFIFSLVSTVLILLVFFQRPGIYTVNYFALFFVGIRYYQMQSLHTKVYEK